MTLSIPELTRKLQGNKDPVYAHFPLNGPVEVRIGKEKFTVVGKRLLILEALDH